VENNPWAGAIRSSKFRNGGGIGKLFPLELCRTSINLLDECSEAIITAKEILLLFCFRSGAMLAGKS
jgi:hypothetical protein